MNIFFRQQRLLQTCNSYINGCRPIFNGKKSALGGSKLKLKILCGAVLAVGTSMAYAYIKSNTSPFNWGQSLNLRTKFNFINKVVEKCAPAVVYVEIKDPRKIDKGTESATIVSNGSGFVVREDGWILTNAHVVINKPNATIEVKLFDGSTYIASVEDADMNIDLALIKINPNKKLQSLNLAKSGDVAVGEWVVALGSPLSLSHSATAGVVSSVNRHASELGLRNHHMQYIQTDAPITFGNSGGPLVNLDGDVIGINNLRITAGISFAIPIDYVSKFLNRIEFASQNKKVTSDAVLGMTTLSMDSELLKELLSRHKMLDSGLANGVLVWKLMQGGIAEKGGLRVGDIITHINGKPVHNANDIYYYISDKQTQYMLRIIRNGENILIPLNEK